MAVLEEGREGVRNMTRYGTIRLEGLLEDTLPVAQKGGGGVRGGGRGDGVWMTCVREMDIDRYIHT